MRNYLIGNSDFKKVIDDISEIAGLLWQKGWAERNAGNLSYNISHIFGSGFLDTDFEPYREINVRYPHLSDQVIMLTATGSRMRDVAKDPYDHTCIIHLDAEGQRYRLLLKPDLDSDLQPTSELPAHLAIHQMLAEKKSSKKVVLHTHPNHLLSLSHIREFCDEETLNNMLWSMQPETLVFVSEGVGFVPYLMTGSEELAEATLKKLEKHRVVMWEKHGCLAVGDTANDAFDLLDVLDKSASLFFICKNAGYDAEGIAKKDLDQLREKFSPGME